MAQAKKTARKAKTKAQTTAQTSARKSAQAEPSGNGSGANLGFEQKLWQSADKMRNNMDAAEYKHVVLGLISPPSASSSTKP